MRTELVQHLPVSVRDDPATEPLRMLSSQFVEAYYLWVNGQVRGRRGDEFVVAIDPGTVRGSAA